MSKGSHYRATAPAKNRPDGTLPHDKMPMLPTDPTPGNQPGPSTRKWPSYLLAAGFFLYMALHWADVVEWVEGQWRLRPGRKTELDEHLRRIDDAVQYALVANQAGYYECYLCLSTRFFLHPNEVWRYGVTYLGEQGRYPGQALEKKDLFFVIQFNGTYSECLKEEKRKLFNYPLLPENLIRPDSLKLLLPPGNFQTR